ncbi:MAG: helix-hairpin-helix domain-containing protein [Lachnospiraceae bacterium]
MKGIGVSLAARIVRKFREDTFRIMEEEPERLAEVKGISEKKAREIAAQMEEKKRYAKSHDLSPAVRHLSQLWV